MEQASARKVLVVDDDRLICWALERELALKRLDRQVARTGKACLEEIGRHGYDVVFLDVHLPDANGIELLPAIRDASPATRVVIISGDGSRKNQEAATAGGAIQFLEKPFELSLVGCILNSLFREYPESRKTARFYCNMRVWVGKGEESSPGAYEVCGKVEDISPAGIRVSTVIPLEPGRTVLLRAIDHERPFSGFLPDGTAAEVRWIQAEPPGYLAGLRYLTPARTSGPGSGESRS